MGLDLKKRRPRPSHAGTGTGSDTRATSRRAAPRPRRRKRWVAAGLLLMLLLATASCDKLKWFGPAGPKVARSPVAFVAGRHEGRLARPAPGDGMPRRSGFVGAV